MKIPIYQIDAFTDKRFGGNPAAVCPLESWLDDAVLQNIAAENNLSETAFFVKEGNGYRLRWFTPELEVDLCGHATLASAYVIFNELHCREESVRFQSLSGELSVAREGELLVLNFPSWTPTPCAAPDKLLRALGGRPTEILKLHDYVAVYDSERAVRDLKPDFALLQQVETLGVIVTARGDRSDFVSRFFAPGAGIAEDPVTGRAHCSLIPYWANTLNKNKLHAFQVSKRGGELFCELAGDRVKIAGHAAKYLEGSIEI